jgi:hypothetical protein
MKRRLWKTFCITTFVLGVAWIGLLPFSFFRVPCIIRTNQQSDLMLRAVDGHVGLISQAGPGTVGYAALMGLAPNSWVWSCDAIVSHSVAWELAVRPHYFHTSSGLGGAHAIQGHFYYLPLWLVAWVSIMPAGLSRFWRRWQERTPEVATENSQVQA